MIPKKLPKIPPIAFSTPCTVVINQEGISEDGEPLQAFTFEGKAIYSQKAKQVMDAEKRIIRIEGSVIFDGNIAPNMPNLADGEVTVAGSTYKIYKSSRPRNPDGSVHHTKLELM